MKSIPTFLFFFTLFTILSLPSKGQKIYHYQEDELELIYFGKNYSYLIPHVVSTFNNAIEFHKAYWDYKHEKTTVILNDFSDYGHGGATALPRSMVILGIEPYSHAFSIIPSSERFQWLFNHELTHITMADKANKTDLLWRKLMLGKVQRDERMPVSALWSYLTVPRWYAPRWYHEGIACFMETWMSGGLGRAMGNYDEMYFRSIVAAKQKIYSPVGLETEGTTIDFQVGANAYLYGTRFITYLGQQYDINLLKDFYSRTDDSKAFYARQFKKIYHQPIKKVWDDWAKWEYEFQQDNIDRIRQYPITLFDPITKMELGSVSKYGYNNKTHKIYAAINYPGVISQIAEIDQQSGSIKKLCDLDSPSLYYSTHLAYDPDRNTIFISEQNHNYRSLVSINGENGKKKTLIRFSRTGELAFNKADRSLWGIQHNNGYTILVKIPEPYNEIIPMYSAEFGKSLFDVAISNDGRSISSSLTGVKGEQSIVLFNIEELEKGIKEFQTIYKLEDNSLTQFKFSNDDRYLIGTSYYTGVSNIWRLSIDGSQFELLSNTETGFFMPMQIDSDSLLVLRFQRDGMLPGTIPIKVIEDANAINYLGNKVVRNNSEVKEWSLSAAPKFQKDSIQSSEGQLHSFQRLELINAYPDVSGFKNTMAVGYRINISDPIGINKIKLFLGTSPWADNVNKQKIHAQLDWKYWNWNLLASYNKTDFYDLFGPTKRSRAGYMFGLNYNKTSSLRKPLVLKYDVEMYTYGKLEVLPQYQNISTPIKNFQILSTSFDIQKLRSTLGGVESEKGYTWKVSASGILAKKEIYPSLVSDQTFGFLVPGIRNTSFWIRNSIGQSFGDRNSSLSQFYFGGFRNNYIDWQPSEQYRKTMAFPGVEIDEIGSYNYIKTMGDLHLKPLRLRNFGTTWLYPTYIKTSFFATHLITDYDKSDISRNIFNFGTQLDIQLVLFSYLKTTWSAGYAIKTEEGRINQDQFMFSVKLLGN